MFNFELFSFKKNEFVILDAEKVEELQAEIRELKLTAARKTKTLQEAHKTAQREAKLHLAKLEHGKHFLSKLTN